MNSQSIHPVLEQTAIAHVISCSLSLVNPVNLCPVLCLIAHCLTFLLRPTWASVVIHTQDGVGERRSDKCWDPCGGGWLWMPGILLEFGPLSHSLTWRRWSLRPLLQSATRRCSNGFGFSYGGAVMSSIFINSLWVAVKSSLNWKVILSLIEVKE